MVVWRPGSRAAAAMPTRPSVSSTAAWVCRWTSGGKPVKSDAWEGSVQGALA